MQEIYIIKLYKILRSYFVFYSIEITWPGDMTGERCALT